MFNKKALILTIASVALAAAGVVYAQGAPAAMPNGRGPGAILKNVDLKKIPPVITGTVTAIDGTNISITSNFGYVPGSTASPLKTTTYTVDASKATIKKINFVTMAPPTTPEADQNGNVNGNTNINTNTNKPSATMGKRPNVASLVGLFKNSVTTITVADIQTGDTLVVTGTVSGTAIAATSITVSALPKPTPENNLRNTMIVGTVQSINGATLTVAASGAYDRANTPVVIYTVDASTAAIRKIGALPRDLNANVNAGANDLNVNSGANGEDGKKARSFTSMSVADIAVNDTLSVSGTISGTNIKAISIVLGVALPKTGSARPEKELFNAAGGSAPKTNAAPKTGIFGKIMDFLSGLFGKKK